MSTPAAANLAPTSPTPPAPVPAPPAARALGADFALRLASAGLLLWGYDRLHEPLVSLFAEMGKWLTGEFSLGPTPKAFAVTVLGVCLLAVWWQPVKKDK